MRRLIPRERQLFRIDQRQYHYQKNRHDEVYLDVAS
jgi:hypothetical protein